jgi:hypothetical protein
MSVARRRETEACTQVSLDLALAAHILSPVPFIRKKPGLEEGIDDDDLETMSRATEALSLASTEPSPVNFGFLRPARPTVLGYYPKVDEENKVNEKEPLTSIGTNLLLQEWVVGTDPRAYEYLDPYDVALSRQVNNRLETRPRSLFGTSQATQPTQQPPAVMPSQPRAPPVFASKRPLVPLAAVQSLGALAPPSDTQPVARAAPLQGETQEVYPSTQVLPGPFGGRPSIVKRKPAKKRVGGF